MPRLLLIRLVVVLAGLIPGAVLAQSAMPDRESVFVDYDDYMRFVDGQVMARDFVPLVMRLGGRDEYTVEQLDAINIQLMSAMPRDFSNSAVLKRVRLGSGFSQEARVYWNDDLSYAYFYALLHERESGLVVLRFSLNTNADAIFDKF